MKESVPSHILLLKTGKQKLNQAFNLDSFLLKLWNLWNSLKLRKEGKRTKGCFHFHIAFFIQTVIGEWTILLQMLLLKIVLERLLLKNVATKNSISTTSTIWVPPMTVHVQVHGSKRPNSNAGHQEVQRCYTRGKSEKSIAQRWRSTKVSDPPWFWNLGQTSPEVQNRGISCTTK